MNTTQEATLQQRQHFRNDLNLMEVPSILNTPEGLHNLYLKLRKCTSVASFSQYLSTGRVQLQINLREGEVCNQVVLQRIKNIFRKYSSTLKVEKKTVLATIKL